MANRVFSDVQALNKQVKVISGTAKVDASGDPQISAGRGFAVAKTASAGEVKITLDDAYVALLSANVNANVATDDPASTQIISSALPDILIRINSDAGSGLLAHVLAENDEIQFTLALRDSSAK